MEVSLRALNNNDSAILGTPFSLYVGDLDSTVTEQQLLQTFSFSKLEGLASAMLCIDSFHRRSLCYGYANFHSFHCATKAIEALNYTILNGKAIRNLASTIDNWKLHQIFSKFGDIQSSKVVVSQDGKSKGYGFVQYSTQESALNAIEKLYAATVEGMELYVGPFIRRAGRIQESASFNNLYVKNLDDDVTEEILDKNLYVKNINDDVDEIELKQYFSQCGIISSVKIMRTNRGISKGFGFVCFSNPDEANRAINTLNGILFHQKPLYVAIAQTKRERTSYLRIMYAKQGPGLASTNFPVHPTLYQRALQVYQAPGFRHGGMIPNGFSSPPPSPLFLTRAGQAAANNLTNGNQRAAANNSMLAVASPDERKDILGQGLYPLVKKLKCGLTPKITEMSWKWITPSCSCCWKKQRSCLSSQKVKKVI
ncbi:polyadenylate-binding protein 7 [Citrus sinensis]|nr:polyadenylate-binding protein 7 [Citrus sinensis]